VSAAIDDFGTGYSSMACPKILPVNEIKIDRSFVRDMATDHSNHVLVESAIDLGHNLGLAVVAEGVEDQPTVTALDDLGCDVVHGYHYATPLAPDQFTRYFTVHAMQPATPQPAHRFSQ
jgi:EAL domain-containing protein (putative c-di-GMP-specific phosphodiesterase class I)